MWPAHPDVCEPRRKICADNSSVVKQRPVSVKKSLFSHAGSRWRLKPGSMPDAKKSADVSEIRERGVALHQPFRERGVLALVEVWIGGQACGIGESISSIGIFNPACKRAGIICRGEFPFMVITNSAEAIWKSESQRSKSNTQAIRKPFRQEINARFAINSYIRAD